MLDKKAISPLIATVILVAVSVALGALVMNFTDTTVVDLTVQAGAQIDQEMKCALDIDVRILTVGSESTLCYNRSGSKNLEFVLENQGSYEIEGVQITAMDYNDMIYTINLLQQVSSHNRTRFNISLNSPPVEFDFEFPPTKVTISPIIISSESKVVCTDNEVYSEEIEVCQ